MNIDTYINKFRLASRELFNHYFLDDIVRDNDWGLYEQFQMLEEQLFQALVSSRIGISEIVYGCYPQEQIHVVPQQGSVSGIPIMLNRLIDSGYWDFPIDKAPQESVFKFISFFDWDQKAYKDNRYIRVLVLDWPGNEELIGKHALIETQYVNYEKA